MKAPPSPAKAPTPPASAGADMLTVVRERLEMYQRAQANAKQAGDSSKARRMDRGIKVCL